MELTVVTAEASHPEFLSANNLMELQGEYANQYKLAMASDRPADAIAASGARQAIHALLVAVYVPDSTQSDPGDEQPELNFEDPEHLG